MSRILSAFLILTVVALGLPVNAVQADTSQADQMYCDFLYPPDLGHLLPPIFEESPYPPVTPGSKYCLWVPPGWDGKNAVIFAHGYVDPARPDGTIPTDQLVLTDPNTGASIDLPRIVMSMGYALAVPSYSKNGLAVKEGVQAVWELGMAAKGMLVSNVYLFGASEGGLVTALAVELHGMLTAAGATVMPPFTAGVSTCGPVGNFVQQVNYWGDFRVAYDYYFNFKNPGPVILTNPISILPETIAAWGTLGSPIFPPGPLQGDVLNAIGKYPTAALKLIASGKAPIDPLNPQATIPATILGILDYNIKATDEARFELSGDIDAYLKTDPNVGNPYDNTSRWLGTWLDFGLNAWVRAGNDRFKADPDALAQIRNFYETNGKLTMPLVTLHTTGDPIVPYWHELLYAVKVWRAGAGSRLISIPIPRYGHCAFTPKEAIFAFALAVFRATGKIPVMPTVTTSAGDPVLTPQDFDSMMNQYAPMEPNFYYLPNIQK